MSIVKFNRTKVVCTIGPASESEEMLKKLMLEGMDVARLNFSHGVHEQHKEVIRRIRKINDELGNHTSILVDLQGPKIRIGVLEEPYAVSVGDRVIIDSSIPKRDGNVLPIQYATFAKDVNPGDMVLADDGKVEMKVINTDKETRAELEIVHGDSIGSRKGVNLPFTNISIPSLTEKDRKDLDFSLTQEPDWIALSFVRTAEEINELKNIIADRGRSARVIAKIEKPEALKNIDEIIAATDAVMVARGDLGVEIPMENVPMWQKIIIRKCNEQGKPVIVATQMMESMINNIRPTRAEATDVANAVMDGADAVMLSGETSVGKYPEYVVRSMQNIIASVESQSELYYQRMDLDKASGTYIHDAINVHACSLADQVSANAIIGMTASGYTAYQLSRCRPKAYIFIFTHNRKMLSVLNLVWGVRAFYYDKYVGTDETIADVLEILKRRNLIRKGDVVINTASMPIQARLRTNMIKVTVVE